jgi:L-aspartate oxidase
MKRYDAIVVGSGLAGLMTALELRGMQVAVVTRAALGDGTSSAWAQGGVAVALGDDDSPELHASDTVAAGAGLVDAGLARDLASEAPAAIARMIELGARLDRAPDGSLAMTREAAHSRRRIVHANGDATGRELLRAAGEAVLRAPHVHVHPFTTVVDLLVEGDRVAGVVVLDAAGRRYALRAPRVVLASGGLGALYRYTTNPREQWGAGLAAAARAGAVLADLEFVQFHPTALALQRDPLPLLTEALRGEGATLVDASGAALMDGVDPRGDLAPRDVVARAVYRAMRDGRGAFLDARVHPGAAFPQRFPSIFGTCEGAGIDPRVAPIPVAAAAHYHMGGIAVDADGRTSLRGLWACGEAAATGLHGANRLASNSLLEALVFARRVASDAAATALRLPRHGMAPVQVLPYAADGDDATVERIRRTMFEQVGIERDGPALALAVAGLDAIAMQARSQQVRDMAFVGAMLAGAALERRESRGSHFRIDFPTASPSGVRAFVAPHSARIPA